MTAPTTSPGLMVDVFAPSYDSAAGALIDVNHDAAVLHVDLTTALKDSGSMAGDDATSAEFSASYDLHAQAVVDASRDLVDASGNLGSLVALSIENHRKGDAAAVYGAPPVIYDGCTMPPRAGEVDVEQFTVPRSEGGDGGDLPALMDAIIDHVQGVVWPNADTAKLRTIGAAWRAAAAALDLLDAGGRDAIEFLNQQRSPEIPLAVAAVRDLRRSARELSGACDDLAAACEDYAAQVDTHRDEIRDILVELAVEAGFTVVAGGVLSIFSAGLASGAAGSLITARAGVYGARIVAVLARLKTAVRVGSVARLGVVGTKVEKVGPVLRRLANRARRGGPGLAATGRRSFGSFSADGVRAAAAAADRNGLTRVGRALQKHAARDGSAFHGLSSGSSAARNDQGMRLIEEMLEDPGTRTEVLDNVTNIWDSSGRGIRLSNDGKFMGLLEPRQ